MKAFITGVAGFIGSNLADGLIAAGHEVVGIDNFSTGRRKFLERAQRSGRFSLFEGDLLDVKFLAEAMAGTDLVIHLSANADVRFGLNHPSRDLEQNTIATHNVLEAMRTNRVKRIAFSSTGSVYGEANVVPTPEDAPFPVQTSLYGASKLAAEGLISAYAEGFGIQAIVFRFVSILGPRYTHGHVFDFCGSLFNDPSRLRILGDGGQRKSYLHVSDCVAAMLLALENTSTKFEIYNLGTDEYCEVRQSASWICRRLGVSPEFEYSGGARGWVGDNPLIFLDCKKIRSLGWAPRMTIQASVENTVDYLVANRDLFAGGRG